MASPPHVSSFITRVSSPPPRTDALKSSILANSQAGWNAATVVSPLKITKQQNRMSIDDVHNGFKPTRGGEPAIPRRSSNSFKHVRNHSLVSNSPFKSPTIGSDSDSGAHGPLGAKYKPVPQSQSGGYKVLPRPSKIPGVTPRKPSPSVAAFRKGSPAQATRRASLEKRAKRDSENLQKALALDALANSDAMAGLGISGGDHRLGFTRRQSKGLATLNKAEYVSKSPFLSDSHPTGSTTTSPSLASSTTNSPQTSQQEESEDLEEPATPTSREHTPEVAVEEYVDEDQTTPEPEVEVFRMIPSASKDASPNTSLNVPSVSTRPLPASPRSRRAAASFSPNRAAPLPPSPPQPAHSVFAQYTPNATPTKSSLKSKRRIRGPRSPGSPESHIERSASGRRRYGSIRRKFERRKTVTFDERCDVLEFEPDEDEGVCESEWVTSEEEDGGYYAWEEQQHPDEERHSYEEHFEHDGYEEEHDMRPGQDDRRIASEVDAINGLVNSILEDEMAGFQHDEDGLEHSAEEENRSIDSQNSVDFREANTSLDFAEGNTSLDFHEGDSFEVEIRSATPHFFSGTQQTIHEEQEPDQDDDNASQETPSLLSQLGPIAGIDNNDSPPEVGQRQLSPIPEGASPFLVQGTGPAFGSSTSLDSRVNQLSRSDSGGSFGGRSSPRISREDVKRRLMQQRASHSPVQPDVRDRSDTEPEDSHDSDIPYRPVSIFNRNRSQSEPSTSDERALPSQPRTAPHPPDMSRHPQSHNPNLQSTTGRSAGPASASPLERSLTTDGNIPQHVYDMHHPTMAKPFDYNKPGVDINDVKSALDRLMIGVENGFLDDRTEPPSDSQSSRPNSMVVETHVAKQETVLDTFRSSHALHGVVSSVDPARALSQPMERSPAQSRDEDIYVSTGRSVTSSPAPRTNLARAKSGKEILKEHEANVIAKRREARRREGSTSSSVRPSKRRSLSTGDTEGIKRRSMLREAAELLDVPVDEVDLPLSDSIDRELDKMGDEKPKYRLRERASTIYATADERISHVRRAGDVDNGKAWRAVRRPSDMNEYAKQIRELRNQEKAKAYGKVFVKVLGLKDIDVPMPAEPTAFNITLNNGIHRVATPDSRFGRECLVDQEFELIEHGQLEFSLTVVVRKDPHIVAQMQANTPQRPTPPPPPPPVGMQRNGIFSLFGSKKSHKRAYTQPEVSVHQPPPRPLTENLSKYLRPDGTLASAFITFKEVARRCDTRLFETSYPLMGHVNDGSRKGLTAGPPRKLGEIVLQIFRLPPLPGVKPDHLPQSLEECHRGLRHIAWHKVVYHEGVLTQNGGDCSTWRRRHIQLIGANLVAFNDVTNKPIATIEFKRAVAVVDNQHPEGYPTVGDPDEDIYRVERSFRLVFPNEEEITFFCDTDEEKAKWLEILRAFYGKIPPNPLWAELIWQRQEKILAGQRASLGQGDDSARH